MPTYIIDTETLDKNDPEVIELAKLEVHIAKNAVAFDRCPEVSLYKPNSRIKFGAMATHHILPSDLDGLSPYPGWGDAEPDLYLIGHNVDFDWRAVGEPECKRICTLALARYLWPEFDSHTLSALMYALSSNLEATRDALRYAHSAGADVGFTAQLLSHILKALPDVHSVEDLHFASENARIPRVMPFGKFAGKPISAVDNGYRSWYQRQEDQDPYLLAAFRAFPYER